MNKNDLVASVADDSGLSKVDAAKAVDSVFDTISKALSSGSDIRLVGFGTFSVAQRRASEGRGVYTCNRRILSNLGVAVRDARAVFRRLRFGRDIGALRR